jgi:hypothetical protein
MNSTQSSALSAGSGRGPAWLWVVAVLWLVAIVVAEQTGALAQLGRLFMPGYAILVALGIVLPTLAYFGVARVRRAVDGIGLHALTLMHAWRIPAALMFFYYGLQGQLPALFWILAGFGDLLAGAYALTVAGRHRSDAHYRRIHRFGFADFVVAVGTGLTFTLLGDPKMEVLTTLPMALIPLFGVGLSGASHVVALYTLNRREHRA